MILIAAYIVDSAHIANIWQHSRKNFLSVIEMIFSFRLWGNVGLT